MSRVIAFQQIIYYVNYKYFSLIYHDTKEKLNVTKVLWLDLIFNELKRTKNKFVNVYKDQCKEY